jgi:endonuclease YncB( thermonuclease family)
MFNLISALVSLVLMTSLALADMSGSACILDGDTIMIDGIRRHGKCVNGVTVRLFGIDAPELEQTCREPNGRLWQCGRASAGLLLRALDGQFVVCKGAKSDDFGQILGICHIDQIDVGAMMVRNGAALAFREHSDDYLHDEDAARATRAGLWRGDFLPPWEWRKLHH